MSQSGLPEHLRSFVRKARFMAWTALTLHTAAACLTLLAFALTLFLIGLKGKEWWFGKTHTLWFENIKSPHRTSNEFETDFTRRLTERGYQVERLRVTYDDGDHQFSGDITLINVPSHLSTWEVERSAREVMDSLKDKHLPVEK